MDVVLIHFYMYDKNICIIQLIHLLYVLYGSYTWSVKRILGRLLLYTGSTAQMRSEFDSLPYVLLVAKNSPK